MESNMSLRCSLEKNLVLRKQGLANVLWRPLPKLFLFLVFIIFSCFLSSVEVSATLSTPQKSSPVSQVMSVDTTGGWGVVYDRIMRAIDMDRRANVPNIQTLLDSIQGIPRSNAGKNALIQKVNDWKARQGVGLSPEKQVQAGIGQFILEKIPEARRRELIKRSTPRKLLTGGPGVAQPSPSGKLSFENVDVDQFITELLGDVQGYQQKKEEALYRSQLPSTSTIQEVVELSQEDALKWEKITGEKLKPGTDGKYYVSAKKWLEFDQKLSSSLEDSIIKGGKQEITPKDAMEAILKALVSYTLPTAKEAIEVQDKKLDILFESAVNILLENKASPKVKGNFLYLLHKTHLNNSIREHYKNYAQYFLFQLQDFKSFYDFSTEKIFENKIIQDVQIQQLKKLGAAWNKYYENREKYKIEFSIKDTGKTTTDSFGQSVPVWEVTPKQYLKGPQSNPIASLMFKDLDTMFKTFDKSTIEAWADLLDYADNDTLKALVYLMAALKITEEKYFIFAATKRAGINLFLNKVNKLFQMGNKHQPKKIPEDFDPLVALKLTSKTIQKKWQEMDNSLKEYNEKDILAKKEEKDVKFALNKKVKGDFIDFYKKTTGIKKTKVGFASKKVGKVGEELVRKSFKELKGIAIPGKLSMFGQLILRGLANKTSEVELKEAIDALNDKQMSDLGFTKGKKSGKWKAAPSGKGPTTTSTSVSTPPQVKVDPVEQLKGQINGIIFQYTGQELSKDPGKTKTGKPRPPSQSGYNRFFKTHLKEFENKNLADFGEILKKIGVTEMNQYLKTPITEFKEPAVPPPPPPPPPSSPPPPAPPGFSTTGGGLKGGSEKVSQFQPFNFMALLSQGGESTVLTQGSTLEKWGGTLRNFYIKFYLAGPPEVTNQIPKSLTTATQLQDLKAQSIQAPYHFKIEDIFNYIYSLAKQNKKIAVILDDQFARETSIQKLVQHVQKLSQAKNVDIVMTSTPEERIQYIDKQAIKTLNGNLKPGWQMMANKSFTQNIRDSIAPIKNASYDVLFLISPDLTKQGFSALAKPYNPQKMKAGVEVYTNIMGKYRFVTEAFQDTNFKVDNQPFHKNMLDQLAAFKLTTIQPNVYMGTILELISPETIFSPGYYTLMRDLQNQSVATNIISFHTTTGDYKVPIKVGKTTATENAQTHGQETDYKISSGDLPLLLKLVQQFNGHLSQYLKSKS